MSESFNEVHQACLESVSENGLLPYYLRARLYEASKTVVREDGFSFHGQFHFFFGVLLFIKCAEYTLPIWELVDSGGELKNFKALLMRGIGEAAKNEEIENFYDRCEVDFQKRIYEWDPSEIDRAGAAGPSCLTAISMYLGKFNFADNVRNEQDIDIYCWDSAFYSSVAVAGGAEWQAGEKQLDSEARAKFWKWYVDEAIVQSYNEAVVLSRKKSLL